MAIQIQRLTADLSDIRLELSLSAACVCCGREEQVSGMNVVSEHGAMQVLHLRGWRRVLTDDQDNTVSCPSCVAELKQLNCEAEYE
ncbi:hypothetical protein [Agarivorans sp. QJM3NY_25]|uniref:hypothetical protein n=1 Tax=Agarivorans sp. QJM3NY_25 TaxID=3421430 RepID=UPI003D7E9350